MMSGWRAADLVSALLILKKITGAAQNQSEEQQRGQRTNKKGREEARNNQLETKGEEKHP